MTEASFPSGKPETGRPGPWEHAQQQGRGPEPLGDILSRLFLSRGWARKSERLRLEAAWEAALEALAPLPLRQHTRVASLRRGVLEVEVNAAPLMQELNQFHKRRLLAALRQALPGTTIADIRFRAGAW
jgi:predicted nucleic acid-binding Zn ribbon protein